MPLPLPDVVSPELVLVVGGVLWLALCVLWRRDAAATVVVTVVETVVELPHPLIVSVITSASSIAGAPHDLIF